MLHFAVNTPRPNSDFETEKNGILDAAKCISFLLVEESSVDGESRPSFCGTAFFVSQNLLVTAGHNVAGVHQPVKDIRITYPGVESIRSLDVANHKVPTITCKVVGTLYKRDRRVSKDIAILDAGSFNAPFYLPLSSVVPPIDAIVDLVGYPDEIKREWIQAHKGVSDAGKCLRKAMQMFPKGDLFVTRGVIRSVGATMTYKMSTCPGLSGSCILYKGAAIG